jgi:hypothetical protein
LKRLFLSICFLALTGQLEARAWSCNVGAPCVFAFTESGTVAGGSNTGGYMWGNPIFISDDHRMIELNHVVYAMPPAQITPGSRSSQWAINGTPPVGTAIFRLDPAASIDIALTGGIISWDAAAKKIP